MSWFQDMVHLFTTGYDRKPEVVPDYAQDDMTDDVEWVDTAGVDEHMFWDTLLTFKKRTR